MKKLIDLMNELQTINEAKMSSELDKIVDPKTKKVLIKVGETIKISATEENMLAIWQLAEYLLKQEKVELVLKSNKKEILVTREK